MQLKGCPTGGSLDLFLGSKREGRNFRETNLHSHSGGASQRAVLFMVDQTLWTQ